MGHEFHLQWLMHRPVQYTVSSVGASEERQSIGLHRDTSPPNLQLMVTLNAILNVTERLTLVNRLLNGSVTYNNSYTLSMIRIIMNPATNVLGTCN